MKFKSKLIVSFSKVYFKKITALNSPIIKIFLTLLCTFLCKPSLAQYNCPTDIQENMTRLDKYYKEGKIDSVYIEVNRTLSKKISVFSQQIMYYELGYYYSLKGNKNEALSAYKKSVQLTNNETDSEEFMQVTTSDIANLFFTHKQYDSVVVYLKKIVDNLSPKLHKRYCDVHSMLGFCYYQQNKIEPSLKEYNLALEVANEYDHCLKPIIINKLARVYGSQKQVKKAEDVIWESVHTLEAECNNIELKINCLKALIEVYRENELFRKAFETKLVVDSLVEKLNVDERNKTLDLAEIKFNTKLKDQENESLKKANSDKDEIVSQQKKGLIIMISAILVFSLLSVVLIIFLRQRNKLNKELAKQKTEIEQINNDLQRFNLLNQKIFSVISHDFKSPIQTLSIMLKNEEISSTENTVLKNYINDLSDQISQSNELLENLLSWAKTELNISPLVLEPVLLNELLEKLKKEFEKKLQEKDLQLMITGDKNIFITKPREVLLILLRNGLSNAIKFSPASRKILINLNHVTCTITDFGSGIPENLKAQILKGKVYPHFGTNLESGFGMGLYLCSELALKHKIILSVENNSSSTGVTFSLKF